MSFDIDDILEQALVVKAKSDENILLGDKLYICLSCGVVTDYWKFGGVCGPCEAYGEMQQEDEHDQN